MKELRILIADNHEVIRCGVRTFLEKQPGWRVCGEAATTKETLQKARTLRPHLLILDVSLPGRAVTDVIPEVMLLCPSVRVVALATRDFGDLAAKALAAGASGLALKSDPATELVLTVQSVAQNKPSLSPGAVEIVRHRLAAATLSEPRLTDLTKRELGILRLLAGGGSNREVASGLALSVRTVDAHRSNIMRKLKLRTYSDLVRFAVRHGLVAE